MGSRIRGTRVWRAGVESLERRTLMCNPGDYYDVATGEFVTGHITQSLIEQTTEQYIPPHEVKVIHSARTTANVIGPQMLSASAQLGPEQIGAFTGTFDFTDNATHVNLLPNGHVMWWAVTSTTSQIWDPVTNTQTDATRPDVRNYQLFCSGHSLLPDGRLFITGGQLLNSNADGAEQAVIFDPTTGEFIYAPDMAQRRWYPTNTTLPDGTVLVVSGRFYIGDQPGAHFEYDIADLPQIYDPKTNTWRDLTSATRRQALYPRMFVAPDGRVFDAGPSKRSYWLDTTGTGKWSAGPSQIYGSRDYGSAVMYAPGKILVMGGTDTSGDGALGLPTATAEIIDLNDPNPQWKSTGSMHFARRQLTATVLPDGRVLATGGTSGPGFNAAAYGGVDVSVYEAEVWDPATGQWTVLDRMHERRIYHSSALLLPDGRVVVAGGGDPMGSGYISGKLADPTKHTTAEYFLPDYLFKGDRPTIADASNVMRYDTTYVLQTPDAASIAKVALVRNGSMTHDFNADQRYVPLEFTVEGDTLTITTPANATLAPAGPYMLFILSADGVPSAAQIVSLGVHGQEIPVAPPDTSTISGLTYNDNNANGVFDTGDLIITGRVVFLDANNNGKLDPGERSTSTDSHGVYTFVGLETGTYHVRRVFPKGYVASNSPWDLAIGVSQNITHVDIGSVAAGTVVIPPGQEPPPPPPPEGGGDPPPPPPPPPPPGDPKNASIGGVLYNDNNANGVFDSGDSPISRVVFLDANNNGRLDSGEQSTTSSSAGLFTFTGLAAGAYHVRREFPPGYKASNTPRDYTLTQSQSVTGADIGSVKSSTTVTPPGSEPPPPTSTDKGAISGVLYNDSNANGIFDTGDTPISRVVYLDTNNNGRLDSGEPSMKSGSDGRFTFTNLPAGAYHVRRDFPGGYKASNPPRDYVLAADQVVTGADIGSVPSSAPIAPAPAPADPTPPSDGSAGTISGLLFWDANRNAAFDTGEPHQAGKTVFIDLDDDNILDDNERRLATDSQGRFTFDGLTAGTYIIKRVVPKGYTITTPKQTVTLAAGQLFSGVAIGTNAV